MNQGEWELLGVFTQFQEFSIETSNSYAEMKFYVSGRGCGGGGDKNAWGSRMKQSGKDTAAPLPTPGPYTFHATSAREMGTQLKRPLFTLTATILVPEAEYRSVTLLPQAIQAGSSTKEGAGYGAVVPGFLSAQYPPSFYPGPRWSSAGGHYSTQSASCCPVSSSWSWTLWAFVCPRTAVRESLSRSRSFWDTQSFSSSCQTRCLQQPSVPPSLVRPP